MAIDRNFGRQAEAITGLSAAERKRRADAAAQEQQFQDQQDQAEAAGQDLDVGGPADANDERDKLVEEGYATKAATDKLFDPVKVGRVQNAASARGALAKLLQNQQDSPEARAANAANLKSKAAQATLAQKAQVGARGMTASGFGASQVAGQQRLGAKAESQGMAAYDMDRRKEEQTRKSTAIGLAPGIQRNELEAEAFLRAQAELNQGDRSKDVGTVITLPEESGQQHGRRATIVSSKPGGAQPAGGPVTINDKTYMLYIHQGTLIAVRETGVSQEAGR